MRNGPELGQSLYISLFPGNFVGAGPDDRDWRLRLEYAAPTCSRR
jgi:hypothetical protein